MWTDETTDVTQSVAIHSAQYCKHIQDGEQALQFLACFQANLDFLFLPADYSRRRQNIIRLLSLPVSKGGRLKRLGGCPPRPRRFWVRPGRTSAWWDNFLAHIVIVKVNTHASGLRSWVIVTKLSFSNRFTVYVWMRQNDAKTPRVDANFLKTEKTSCVFKRIRMRVDGVLNNNNGDGDGNENVISQYKLSLFESLRDH